MSANSVDPNLKNDVTDEFIVGLDREIGAGFAVGANYIWRKYGNFQWNDREGITTADWVGDDVHAAGERLPGRRRQPHQAANCPTVTYFEPTFQQPTVITLANIAGLQPGVQRRRADRRGSGCRTTG